MFWIDGRMDRDIETSLDFLKIYFFTDGKILIMK